MKTSLNWQVQRAYTYGAWLSAFTGLSWFALLVLAETPSVNGPITASSEPAPVAPAAVSALAGDTDGDGLSDADEGGVYGTHPNKFDTDEDGQGDGAEIRAGTNPKVAGSVFRIVGSPERLAGGGWRIAWSSVSGKIYTLQRWNSPDLSVSGNPIWSDVARVSATGPSSFADDLSAGSLAQQFYRVMLVEEGVPAAGPTVSAIQASPASLAAEGVVTLSVAAQDPMGVVEVSFFDGLSRLGAATRIEGDTWRLFWPVGFEQNGIRLLSAQAMNVGGYSNRSVGLAYTVAITNPQVHQQVGRIWVSADRFQTNGSVVVPGGNVRLGTISLSAGSLLSVDESQGIISGRGAVNVPGLGQVFDGSFVIDVASGWLRAQTGAAPASLEGLAALAVVRLNSRTVLTARELSVNVISNVLRGSGLVELQIPNQNLGAARIDGAFFYDPATFLLSVEGTFGLGSITGAGRVTVRLGDSTFLMSGTLNFNAGTGGGAVSLSSATLQLAFGTNGAPVLTAAGLRTINQTSEAVLGALEPDGSFKAGSTLPPTPNLIREDSDRFVPLGLDGRPMDGIAVQAREDGSLPPLEYRPAGRSLLGHGRHLYIRFPAGARWVESNGENYLEYIQANAGFGPSFPLQMAEPLERLSGPAKRLRIGPVSLADLVQAFDRSPALGVPVVVFNHLPLVWKGGVLEDGGIRGAQFGLANEALPLPPSSGNYPQFTLDVSNSRGIQIPFYGEFTLPDGSANSPRLAIAKSHPVWLSIAPNGQVALKGRVDVKFPGGKPSFRADFGFDDPHYYLQMVAGGIHVPMLRSLGQMLPEAACISAQTPAEAQALNTASVCLDRYERAYLNFSASMVGALPEGESGMDNLSAAPPDPYSALAGVLEAWSYSRWVNPSANPTGSDLKALFKQTGNSAVAAHDLDSILAYRLALERARQAGLQAGNEAEFNLALSQAMEAAIRRAQEPNAVVNLRAMREVMRRLLETEALIQQSGTALSDERLRTAMSRLLESFAASYVASLGVVANVFLPDQNPTINAMNRFAAYEALAQLAGLIADSQQLGLDQDLGAPVAEALVQLAGRLQVILTEELEAAEAAGDYPAFTYALEDYLDLVDLRQKGLIPPHGALPALISFTQLASRLGGVFQADMAKPAGERGLNNQAAEVRRLLRILRQMAGTVTFAREPFQRTYERMEQAISRSLLTVAAETTELKAAIELMEAGILQAQLRDQFNFGATFPWESDAGLFKVVEAIGTKGASQRAWSELHRAARLLMGEADRLNQINQQARRKVYLEQAARIVAASRAVAEALVRAHSILQAMELLLPGDLYVDRVAGAVRYNRLTHLLEGNFSGQLRMPNFDLSLTVLNASISTGGAFDLNVYGSVGLPPNQPQGTLSIMAAHPLHIQFQPPQQLKFAGSGRLALNNGMVFESFLTLEDPVYGFGIAAQGLRFDLADKLRLYVPTLPDGQVFTTAAARDLNDYFRSMSATFAGLATFTEVPPAPQPGAPPDFSAPPPLLPTDSLEAWASAELADARLGLAQDYSSTLESVKQNLGSLAAALRQQAGEISPAELEMRNRVLGKLCASLEKKKVKVGGVEAEVIEASPELRAFIQETESGVLALLNKVATQEDEGVQQQAYDIAGDFYKWASCYSGFDPNRVLEAFKSAVQSRWIAFAGKYGIDLLTGEPAVPSTVFESINYSAFRGIFLQYVNLYQEHVNLELASPPMPWVKKVGQTIAMRWRSLLLRQIRPLDVRDVANYALIGTATRDLSLLSCSGDNEVFEYPAGPIEQLEGPDRPYDPDIERTNRWYRFYQAAEYSIKERPYTPDYVRHMRVVTRGALSVAAEDIQSLATFVSKLTNHVDGVSEYLWNIFSQDTRDQLLAYGKPGSDAARLRLALANEFYEIIPGGSIYNPQRFAGIALSDETRELLGRMVQDEELMRLNRALLEDAYPQEIPKKQGPILERYWPDLELLRLPIQEDPYQCGYEFWPANAVDRQVIQKTEDEFAGQQLTAAEIRLLQTGTTGNLQSAIKLLKELVWLAGWAQQRQLHYGESWPELPRLQRNVRLLTAKFTAAVEVQRAWWYANQYTQILLDAVESKALQDARALQELLLGQAHLTLRTSSKLLNDLKLLLPGSRPIDLKLPGDLVIDRVFGEVQYRRDTHVLSGKFGGRLEFPQLAHAWFDVPAATLSSDGNFSFAANTGGPLPFGGVSIKSAQLNLNGGLVAPPGGGPPVPKLTRFDGSGTLVLPKGQEISASLSYDQAAHKLAFDTDVQKLIWRLTDDVVLFDAGFGFEIHQAAQQGRLTFRGSAGLLKDRPALPPEATLTNLTDAQLRDLFKLVADDLQTSVAFDTVQKSLSLTLDRGTLKLPALFTNAVCNPDLGGGATNVNQRPSIEFNPANKLTITFREDGAGGLPSVQFGGSLTFKDFGLAIPQLPGLSAVLCSATLVFPDVQLTDTRDWGAQLPEFDNVQGKLRIPLPPGETNEVDLVNGKWKLTGFPSGTLLLVNPRLKVLDRGGFVFNLLGGNSCGAGKPATGITVEEGGTLGNPPQPPKFTLYGGIELGMPIQYLKYDTGAVPAGETNDPPDQVRIKMCGSLVVEPGKRPEPQLDAVGVSGDFQLGDSGVKIKGGSILLENLTHIFNTNQNVSSPFTISLSGTLLLSQGPAFGMQNARFVFDNANPSLPGLPRFIMPSDLTYAENEWQLVTNLPVRVTRAKLTIKDTTLQLPDLFSPTNLKITTSMQLTVPPDEPVLQGQANDVEVSFNADGVPEFSLYGLGFDVSIPELPPLTDVKGKLYVGGLSKPEELFFTGKVGGTYDGYKINLLLAMNLSGLIGLCVDVNLGNIGIPLDGYYLGGVMLTGYSGGFSLANTAADPCEFTTYMDTNGYPRAVSLASELPKAPLSWAQFNAFLDRYKKRLAAFGNNLPAPQAAAQAEPNGPFATAQILDAVLAEQRRTSALAEAPAGNSPRGCDHRMTEFEIPCPCDCPPPTINLFCQPHPDQGQYPNRVIVKFSSIDERTLNYRLGITPSKIDEWLSGVGSGGATGEQLTNNMVQAFAHKIRSEVEGLIVRPNAALPNAADINRVIDESLDLLEQGATNELANTLFQKPSGQTIYDAIREQAYKGIATPDITLCLSGYLTHEFVASFLYGNVKAVISTAGSAGLIGTIDLVGIPAGKMQAYVSGTDARGDINPSVCGQIDAEFGPLKLGSMRASLEEFANIQAAFRFLEALAACVPLPDLVPFIQRVAPRIDCTGKTGIQILNELDRQERTALMFELRHQPPIPDLAPALSRAIGAGWDAYNPQFLLCSEVKPSLYGVPLGSALVNAAARLSKTNFIAALQYAPLGMVAFALACEGAAVAGASALFILPEEPRIGLAGIVVGGVASVFGGVGVMIDSIFIREQVQHAFAVDWPDASQTLIAGLSGQFDTPEGMAKYADQNVDFILERAVYADKFTLSPLGFRTLDAEARCVAPNLTDHPARPGSRWIPPERRDPPLPSRYDLLLGALTNRLVADVRWKGNSNDLWMAFPTNSPQCELVRGKSFALDYFPHGGRLGGAFLQFPRAFIEAPPECLYAALNETNDILTRLGAALDYVEDYIAKSVAVGALSFYVPAPNPPFFTNSRGEALSHQELLSAINNYDPSQLGALHLYPLEEFFLRGYLQGQLLGVPIGRLDLAVIPPDFKTNTEGFFRATATVPATSWLNYFVDQASLSIDLRHSPKQLVEVWGSNAVVRLDALNQNPPAGTTTDQWDQQRTEAVLEILSGLVTNLPKVAIEASLTNLHIPTNWSRLLGLEGSTSARLVAYSPRYAPETPGTGPIAEAKRNGGIAFQGNLRLGNLVSVPNAELSFLPRGDNLPLVSGRFQNLSFNLPGGLSMTNAQLDFSSEPASLRAEARWSQIDLPPFMRLVPLDGERELRAALTLSNAGPSRLQISPAQLTLGPFLGTGTQVRVHGAATNEPFTYSSDGPWNASVSFSTNGLTLLSETGEVALQVQTIGLKGTLSRPTGTNRVDLQVTLPRSILVTCYPGQPYQQTLRLAADARLRISSDGSFELVVTNAGAALSGLPALPGGAFSIRRDEQLRTRLSLDVNPIALGACFNLSARTGKAPLKAVLEIASNGSTRLLLDPAQMTFTALTYLGSTPAMLVDGGSDTNGIPQPFSFSTAANESWQARVTFQNYVSLALNSTALLGYTNRTTSSISGSLSGQGLQSGSIALAIADNQPLTILPGNLTYGRTFGFQAGSGQLTLRSDGTFRLTGSANQALDLSNWTSFPIRLALGAAIDMTQASLSFALNGGTVGTIPGAGAQGQIALQYPNLPVVTPSLGGSLSFAPWKTGVFEVSPITPGATNLTATLANTTLTLSGAKLRLTGVFTNEITLPPLTLDAAGNFSKTINPLNLYLPVGNSGFLLPATGFTVTRTSGALLVTNFNGYVVLPGLNVTNTLSGSISSDGTATITSTLNGDLSSLSNLGLPVGSMAKANSIVGLSRSRATPTSPFVTTLMITGDLTGGVLGMYSPALTARGTLTLSPSGTITLAGNVSAPPLVLGKFTLESTSADGRFQATLDSRGLTFLSGNARLKYNNWTLCEFPLPGTGTQFNIPAPSGSGFIARQSVAPHFLFAPSGNFGFNLTSNLDVVGFNVGQASFWFGRSNNVTSLIVNSSQLTLPGFSTPKANVSGTLNSDGTFSLASAANLALSLPGSAVTGLANGKATLSRRLFAGTLQPVWLTLSGNFTGGCLAYLPLPAGTAGLTLSLSTTGTKTFSGTIDVSPLALGIFKVQPSSGDRFVAHLANNGLVFDSGANLVVGSWFSAPLLLPAFTVVSDGSFNPDFGRMNQTLFGFSFSDIGVRFNGVLNGASSLVLSDAKLSGLGLTVPLSFNGRISQDGSLAMSNVVSSPISFFNFSAKMTNTLALNAGQYRSVIVADGPEAYWRLGDNYVGVGVPATSYQVKDETGRHHTTIGRYLVTTNPIRQNESGALLLDTNTSFRFGQGANTANQYISVGEEPAFDITGAISIEAWIKADQWDGSWRTIIAKGDTSWRLHQNGSSRKISFGTYSEAQGWHDLPSYREFDSGAGAQWHHLIATFDGTNKLLYIDGLLEAAEAVPYPIAVNDYPVTIGSNAQYPQRTFKGWIDEVAVYKRALSPVEVLEHYQAGGGSGVLATKVVVQLPMLGGIELKGTWSKQGDLFLQGSAANLSLVGFPLKNVNLWLVRAAGYNTAMLGANAALNDAWLPDIATPFPTVRRILTGSPTFSGTIDSGGYVRLSVNNQSLKILGYDFNELNLTLNGYTDVPGSLGWANGSLQIGGLDALRLLNLPRLNGVLTTNNLTMVSRNLANRWLGGFKAPTLGLSFDRDNGLKVSGSFDLKAPIGATTVDFGDISFAGGIKPDASFTLKGTGSLDFGNSLTTDLHSFILTSSGISPDVNVVPNLNFGNLDVGLTSLSLSSSGISIAGTKTGGWDWSRIFDWPPPGGGDTLGDVSTKFSWSVSFGISNDSQNPINASLTADFGVRERRPDGYNEKSKHFDSQGIGSNGSLSFDLDFKTIEVDFSTVPPSAAFSRKGWSYPLW